MYNVYNIHVISVADIEGYGSDPLLSLNNIINDMCVRKMNDLFIWSDIFYRDLTLKFMDDHFKGLSPDNTNIRQNNDTFFSDITEKVFGIVLNTLWYFVFFITTNYVGQNRKLFSVHLAKTQTKKLWFVSFQ